MNSTAINEITNKLKVIPDNFTNDVLQYLEFLYFKNVNTINDFTLSDDQIALLDKRSTTDINNCIPADKAIQNLKNKYSV